MGAHMSNLQTKLAALSIRAAPILVSAIVLTLTPALAQEAPPISELDQGWDSAERLLWYEASQGSRLIPRAVQRCRLSLKCNSG